MESDWRNHHSSQSINPLATSGKKSRCFTEVRGFFFFRGFLKKEFGLVCSGGGERPREWESECIFTDKAEGTGLLTI